MNDPLPCTEVRDLIPELAAGVASREERAEALAHLARCPACRGELEETAAVVDDLLVLGPSKEPPGSRPRCSGASGRRALSHDVATTYFGSPPCLSLRL